MTRTVQHAKEKTELIQRIKNVLVTYSKGKNRGVHTTNIQKTIEYLLKQVDKRMVMISDSFAGTRYTIYTKEMKMWQGGSSVPCFDHVCFTFTVLKKAPKTK